MWPIRKQRLQRSLGFYSPLALRDHRKARQQFRRPYRPITTNWITFVPMEKLFRMSALALAVLLAANVGAYSGAAKLGAGPQLVAAGACTRPTPAAACRR